MPIGVPKVPFRTRGDRNPTWVDIINRLYRERLIFLGQVITNDISNQLIALMLYLSWESEIKDLYLLINSPGGWVMSGLAIYDTMQFVRPDIETICVGLAASMGSVILVGGEITKRIAFPHARVMIHEPAAGFFQAQASDLILEAEELLKLRETLVRIYVQRTGKPFWIVSEDLERDTFMSATEAQAHGIVDVVAVK
uniref:ATP-dependent Clp protease proteolytic subunit n=2 Tax=Koelreuteria TaxID=43167 RepID=A0A891M9K1_9ROSI|nr:clp protease proteolytic subunit [Koelreuteria paniculata]AVA29610.1 clp protease proteolytic subunit [Koelreuteria paniculata]QRM17513.1 ATP-dependent Clp protease proteolytic subunit [Koelreuteria bipinnata]